MIAPPTSRTQGIEQPCRDAEREVDHAPIKDLFNLHQLISSNAQRVGHGEEERDPEHRPGRAIAARGGGVEPGLAEQIRDQQGREQ